MSHAYGLASQSRRKIHRIYRCTLAASLAMLSYNAGRSQSAPGAFQGSITSHRGSVDRAVSGNSETITIGSPTARIDWSPYDKLSSTSPIDFLPAGHTATFTSTPSLTDYTVLNRIFAKDLDRPIALNGTVISTLQGTSAIGGHVWFYSPGGILIGATAVFDVGGLLLTVIDPDIWSTSGTGFNAVLDCAAANTCERDPVFPGSKIQVLPGAKINALQQNSYVAMVAPRVEQGGTVRVNGSAAYVAAEKVRMTFDQGLFDIQVDLGTSDANGVVHTGETSGPASSASGDHHAIYLVAVPKNQALTMLLDGGTIGFGDAVHASIENGQIILSAGYSVSGGSFDPADPGGATEIPTSGIAIAGGDFTSSLIAAATGSIEASGSITADQLDLTALDIVSAGQIDASTIIFSATRDITTDDLQANDLLSFNAGGDLATGTLISGGSIELNANGDAFAGNLTGDTVTVNAGGDLTIADVEAQEAAFTAGALASFDGVVAAGMITVTSSDIHVEQGGSLGVFGVTELLTLNAVSHGEPVVVGSVSNTAPGQYLLLEDGALEADAIIFNAIGEEGGPGPDILVGDFDISGTAAQDGGVGSFTLNTDGNVLVEGDLTFANAAASDTLTINAGDAIEVDTSDGSIVLTDSTGQLAGLLNLNADNIWITDSALLDQLENNPSFPGRDEALATNNGVTDAAGFVRAGTITATLSDTFLVQNGGTDANPAGIAVGDGGLTIVNDGQGAATVIVFGSQTNFDGTIIAGKDFVGEVALVGEGGFTSNSTVNGCAVGVPCIALDLPVESILGPVKLMTSTLDVDPITLVDLVLSLSGENDSLDDPVTSGSDPVPFDSMTSGNDAGATDAVSRCKKRESGARRCK